MRWIVGLSVRDGGVGMWLRLYEVGILGLGNTVDV